MDVRAEVGEKIEEKTLVREKRMDKSPTALPATKTSTALREAMRSPTVVRSVTKRWDAKDRWVVLMAKRTIQPKSAPMSSLAWFLKLTRVIMPGTRLLADKNKRPTSVMHQASLWTSLVRGIVRWAISR